ncbi:hypothetical protein HYDPIDRAFT_113388, partial [Hydnomerulius pinastri MD-312]
KTSTVTKVGVGQPSISADAGSTGPALLPAVFTAGSNLEHIPDDVLYEILSHLPTIKAGHVMRCHDTRDPPVIPTEMFTRTATMRALSQVSRLLRSLCLAMAWRRAEICGADHHLTFFKVVGEAMKAGCGVLKGCPYLRPLVQTVTVVLTRYQAAEIMPAFVQCLASLPNVTTIEIVHAHSRMTTALKNTFEGKQFPSVRKMILPSCAHEILRCCPNVEEVICNEDSGSRLVGAIMKGNCNQVQILKGINAPSKRLIKFLPNLIHIGLPVSTDIKALAMFQHLAIIELELPTNNVKRGVALAEQAAEQVTEARKVLQGNKSQAEKFVRLTKWEILGEDNQILATEVVRV